MFTTINKPVQTVLYPKIINYLILPNQTTNP